MTTIRAANAPLITHEVENQPPPLSGRNIALDDRPMLEAALEYEQAHGKRKGAIAAIEHALAEKESD